MALATDVRTAQYDWLMPPPVRQIVAMEITALLDNLDHRDYGARRAAGDALVKLGAPAVPCVLAVLMDEQSPVDWAPSAGTLQRMGGPAFDALVGTVETAGAAETRRRAG
ncbi:hypothetical protein ACWGCW_32130 [Streptomyces sp. NPDC054933]